ncbi:MAG: PAS domain-containing protein [Deltaproteobacteria bacterium]|nr:PAS domain-containing protein [Deltaproteobacteria bacterium]
MSRITDTFPVEDLNEALRSAGVGVWSWDIATNVIRWSDVTHRIYDVTPEQFTGEYASFAARIHPDDRQRVEQTIADAVRGLRQDYTIEHRLILPANDVRWVEGRGRVVSDQQGRPLRMIGTVVDITARKASEEELRKGEERLRLFTTHATDYVYEVRGEEHVPHVVAGSFERTTGLTIADVRARGGWMQVVHAEDRERLLGLLDEIRRGRSLLNEYRIIDGAGRTRWLRDRIVPVLSENGALEGVVGGVSDITEQHALQERLVEAQRLEALGRLAAGVAHDFNNLLTVLMAESSFLQEPNVTDEIKQTSLQAISLTLERATNLTSSLLAFGRKNVRPVAVLDFVSLLHKSHTMLSRAAGERLDVSVRCEERQLPVVAEPSDVQLVLLHLILNAREAMPRGGRVVLSLQAVTLSLEDPERPSSLPPGTYARLVVRDEGPGIDREALCHIFEPYFTTKGHGGTGLGLPTSLGIVQRYGGLLRLKETSARGSLFEVLLPVSDQPFARAAVPPSRAQLEGTEHILLVEDDGPVRSVLSRLLQDRGYHVTAVASTEQALALGDALANVQVLLTDVRLPGQSGLDLAAHLRRLYPRLPVLAMSGHVEDPEQQAQLTQGRYPFIAKPFSNQALLLRLREVLDRGV